MRTNIDLDEQLLAEAMAATGLPTEKATIEEALRSLVKRRRLATINELAGLGWNGDLDTTRQGRKVKRPE